jgi:hypothetical protein
MSIGGKCLANGRRPAGASGAGRNAKLIFQDRNRSMLGIIEGFAHVGSYEI